MTAAKKRAPTPVFKGWTKAQLAEALTGRHLETERLRAELLTAAALHDENCEVRRWADKPFFGPPARCSCKARTRPQQRSSSRTEGVP